MPHARWHGAVGVSVVWTTNFDRVIEDAAANILGTTTPVARLSQRRRVGYVSEEEDFRSMLIEVEPEDRPYRDN